LRKDDVLFFVVFASSGNVWSSAHSLR
jgi:hypothetical protein